MEIIEATDSGVANAVEILKKGGIVAHATETCYGLACDLSNTKAVQKLFKLKCRPEGMPVSALFANIGEAKKYVEWNHTAEHLAQTYLPGPLTIIVPMKLSSSLYPAIKLSDYPTLGIRVSSHPVAQLLARTFGKPLSTTSANVHGGPDPYFPAEITIAPDLILDSGPLPRVPPSTVILIEKDGYRVLRQGAIVLNQ